MLDMLLPFTDELLKIAFVAKGPRAKAEVKAERHFLSDDKNWGEFEKNLRSKHFRSVVSGHPQADDKLRKYVKNYGGYLASKETVGQAPSERTEKVYLVKKVDGRWACNCGNWQYRKSVDGGDCKHIRALKKELMVKQSFAASLVHGLTTVDQSRRRAKKNLAQGNLAMQAARAHTVAENQNLLQQQLRG